MFRFPYLVHESQKLMKLPNITITITLAYYECFINNETKSWTRHRITSDDRGNEINVSLVPGNASEKQKQLTTVDNHSYRHKTPEGTHRRLTNRAYTIVSTIYNCASICNCAYTMQVYTIMRVQSCGSRMYTMTSILFYMLDIIRYLIKILVHL